MEPARSVFSTPSHVAPQRWHNTMSGFGEYLVFEPGPINKLPIEILAQIFGHLRLSELDIVTRVNWHWYTIAFPILYKTVHIGRYSYNTEEAEKLLRHLMEVTFIHKRLRLAVRNFILITSSHKFSEKETIPYTYPNLETLTTFSVDRNCDQESYYRMMTGAIMPNLKLMHLGLRCETAELEFPKLFAVGVLSRGLPNLEEFRYSRLRTKSEAARIGEGSCPVVEDAFAGSPLEGKFNNTMAQSQFFMTYVYYLSAIPHLKILDLDLGVTHDTVIDLRDTINGCFKTISEFLGTPSAESYVNADRIPTRERLMFLRQQQFNEIVTDIADEITRRTTRNKDGSSTTDSLPPVHHYLPRRNHLRAKLATLSKSSFEDLAIDIRDQLLKSYPRLSAEGYKYIFPISPPFEHDYFNAVSNSDLIEQVQLLRVQPKESQNLPTALFLRDMQAYLVPLIYERLEEHGMVNIEKVRVRLVVDGPWIEVLIKKDHARSEVEVVSFFPDIVTTDDEKTEVDVGKWGVYAVYRGGNRAVYKCALLKSNGGRWDLVTHK